MSVDRFAGDLGASQKEMFFRIALMLLVVWLLGIVGVYQLGEMVHAFLAVGLMFLFLAFLEGRREIDTPAGQ
jgi:hypothetical protein